MKKILSLLLCIPLFASLAACSLFEGEGTAPEQPGQSTPEKPEQPGQTPPEQSEQPNDPSESDDPVVTENNYLKDLLFMDGFRLSKTDEAHPDYHAAPLVTVNQNVSPKWTVAQWSSKYDLMNGTRTGGFGEYTFEYTATNPSAKKLVANTKTGALSLTLNAETEYDHDRVTGEPWPCILLEQSWFGDELIRVADLKSLVMRMDYKITKLESKMQSPDSGLHCAQLVWYVTLQNRNLGSADYGKYIWFGLCLYDNRMAGTVSNLYAAEDGGKEANTGAFIYQPSSSEWSETGLVPQVREKTQIRFNLLRSAKEAYDLAISRNYLGTTKFEDLYIGSTNFGFEVTGTYNVSADISDLGIIWEQKESMLPAQNKQ